MKMIKVEPCANISGSVGVAGDKSISHRALMFASLAQGQSRLKNLLEGHDCMATLQLMRSLGVHIELTDGVWLINGRGKAGLLEPSSILDCKNSGTTMRLMAGLLSAMPFMSVLDGTEQIKTRPMDRVIKPLLAMNARIHGCGNDRYAPLVTLPAKIHGTHYHLVQKSAQVKSAIILAALFADTPTQITNVRSTRDHTERLLGFMGAPIENGDDVVHVSPLSHELKPINLVIPGDMSSAAFLLVAGALCAADGITITDVNLNETRTGIVDALRVMGASIHITNQTARGNEPVGDVLVKKSALSAREFSGDIIVRMIDEIPLLALAATQAIGVTVIKNASELKVKETNRIARTVEILTQLGARIDETNDGMIIHGPTPLCGGLVSSFLDHRLAMMASIAGLIAQAPVSVSNAEVSDDSFPGFYEALIALGVNIYEID